MKAMMILVLLIAATGYGVLHMAHGTVDTCPRCGDVLHQGASPMMWCAKCGYEKNESQETPVVQE